MENSISSKIQQRNLALKKELWAKEYQVIEIGKKEGEPDYLIVRCASPKEDNPNNN